MQKSGDTICTFVCVMACPFQSTPRQLPEWNQQEQVVGGVAVASYELALVQNRPAGSKENKTRPAGPDESPTRGPG
jgi:hypothetical protein